MHQYLLHSKQDFYQEINIFLRYMFVLALFLATLRLCNVLAMFVPSTAPLLAYSVYGMLFFDRHGCGGSSHL